MAHAGKTGGIGSSPINVQRLLYNTTKNQII